MNKNTEPCSWLMKNSDGNPDFLFTILTFSFLLLTLISLLWISFGCLGVLYSENLKRAGMILEIMSDMKTGLISLAGLVFGLAGSYTVRRFKRDELGIKKDQQNKYESELKSQHMLHQPDLKIVSDMEDI